jgi:ADP-heptose:LPS heptosyltransferase
MIAPLRHVLICRTDNLGDVVLTLPLAGYLRQRFPDIKIGFLCRQYAVAVVVLCEAVDYVIDREFLQAQGSDPLAHASEWLRNAGIDTIIFAKPDRWLSRAAKKAGIKNRVGTSHRIWHWWTCNRLAHFSRVKSSLHEAQLNFALLRPLGIDEIPPLRDIASLYKLKPITDYPPLGNSSNIAPDISLDRTRFNLIVHPKSNGNGREWPAAYFVALAQLLESEPQIQLYITGSQAEGEWLSHHTPLLLAQSNVRNLCGLLSLAQLCETIAAADGLIASGTGPVHIAAALKQRTLGLYPPAKPIHPGRWAPIGTHAQTLCRGQSCKGCNDSLTCECMRCITPHHVADVVMAWFDEAKVSNLADGS